MYTSYKNIFQLSFNHDAGAFLSSLKIMPAPETTRILKNYRMLFKQKGNEIYLLHAYTNDIALVSIEEQLNLRFYIDFNYQEVIATSNLDLYNPKESCLYLFSDQENNVINQTNVIPILQSGPAPEELLDLYSQEIIDMKRINEGVFFDTVNKTNIALFSFSNNKEKGYLDIKVKPNAEVNRRQFNFDSRQLFVQYLIFDRHKQYSGYSIENNLVTFDKEELPDKTILTSNEKVTFSELRKHSLSLKGVRNNGRAITLKENLPIPNLNNLTQGPTKEFLVSSFFYV